MIFVSIAQDNQAFDALRRGVALIATDQPRVDGKPANLQHKELLIPPEVVERPDKLHTLFADIAVELSRWVGEDEVTVLVSQVHPLLLNPLRYHERHGLEFLLAMLILAFPEVRWFFGTIKGYPSEPDHKDAKALDEFRARHHLFNLFQPQQTSLFDGAGLRDWVRRLAKEDARYIPRREQLAVAMDEETNYAYLDAYTAYRFGFRALAISDRGAADAVLGLGEKRDPAWGIPDLVLEDLHLNFPDGGGRLSDLGDFRQKEFPVLEEVSPIVDKNRRRILVTSGYQAGNFEKNNRNRRYIAQRKIGLLHKPHAGIFVVWERSGFDGKPSWKGNVRKYRRRTGRGYIWPPDWQRKEQGANSPGGHSSPGILLVIARHLIDRAEVMLAKGPLSVEEAVRGAVLAGDALEILGGKTPTVAAEALSLKHQFELHAEYEFIGVENDIPLEPRFQEIKRDAESIAHWFEQHSKQTALIIRINVVNQLLCILRAYNQFDEEQQCMDRARHLHNSLYMQKQPWRYIFWPVLRYSEFLLSSLLRFTLAIVLWIVGLTGLFSLLLNDEGSLSGLPIVNAIATFLGVTPAPAGLHSYWSIALSAFAIVAGLAHLGVFISYLYTLVSRR
uniref:Uncharacterized protein n=1 Tax=Candidatus Kentrum sp. MB TaxID=2138164 RepID=A0A451B9L8_9GAMM|nr:MAG: hypothetical protein BECKMB1821G_GA0114241_100935 [Candidatus Kentron sp. MB]VFK27036.1 MAG: hypothetical protein BECKMB1821I_GA0114274_100217 [Candidatus Kentron sp. MB]VFK74927.1 MAG: hypothetical protein BECKMB1821H_GA0114242_101236 [Candidatus Kentron sp. MB]